VKYTQTEFEEMGSFKAQGWIWSSIGRTSRVVARGIRGALSTFWSGIKPPRKAKPIPMEGLNEVQAYTSFDGADLMVFLNGKVLGELQGITWNFDADKDIHPVSGQMVFAMFNKDVLGAIDINPFKMTEPIDIVLQFTNEYGESAYREIKGVLLVKYASGYSIDDFLIEEVVEYIADSITQLQPGKHNLYKEYIDNKQS
jgi:hypothetical protein